MKKNKKKKNDDDKPLKHITVYFQEGEPIRYSNPSDCTINEKVGVLHIRLNNKSIVYNLSYIRAYEFEEGE